MRTERVIVLPPKFPRIVCLCGSTRFMEAFQEANLRETLAGRIVLSVGCDTKSDAMLGLSPEIKAMLDELHKRKIDLAHEILVLNVGGYIGASTRSEIAYAKTEGKAVRYLEPYAPCPFCPLMGIDEDQYRTVEPNFFGNAARIGDVASCEPCATVALATDSTEALLADLQKQTAGS